MMGERRQRGLALVSVLWGIAILSLIAAAMMTASVTSARIDHNVWDATRASAVADIAVNRAILSLMDDRAKHQPRVDGVPADNTFDGAPARLWIQDESGKINVNGADKTALQALFAAQGMSDGDAGALADTVIARRSPQTPYHATEELLAAPGMSRALYGRIAPLITAYGHAAGVNTQVAPPGVLRVMPGMTDQAVRELLTAREASRSLTLASADTTSAPLAQSGGTFLITAEVHVGKAHLVRSAAVMFTGDDSNPYVILGWH
jgi:general secretion pathway protein K